MSDKHHAIRRLSREKGYHAQHLPNDIWEFWKEPGGPVKTAYCTQRALDWITSVSSPQTNRLMSVPDYA